MSLNAKTVTLEGWIQETTDLMKPDKVVWISEDITQKEELYRFAIEQGILTKLNEELYEDSYIYRSNLTDVARVEQRTFICTKTQEEVGNTNNWMHVDECYKMMLGLYDGCMKGKTMYVIPFCMGPIGSPFSKCGIQVTDSVYVVLSMKIMTRVGNAVLDRIKKTGEFVRCLHAVDKCDPEKRYITHFPDFFTIMSINSEYGGNALLGKKSFALRIASNLGKKEGWMAEHMLTLGVEKPNGEIIYVSAAFPSACGKTNFAMLIPPKVYEEKGYKIWCVSDDITWFHIGEDGRLWGINPENGFFGVVPGTSKKTNANALKSMMKDTIFTNVVHDLDNNAVWWEGLDEPAPTNALDWQGNKWDLSMGTKGAHPNSRFASCVDNCPSISSEVNAPNGVPISAMIFGGRRSTTIPLVYQSFDWEHGVFLGSVMASETTAAAAGQQGVVRTDPMAMLPFCGYNMGDYFDHWLEMGQKLGDKAPKIFNVNWFRVDENGKFIWPGYSENMRALIWMLERCDGTADAQKTPIGFVPNAKDINIEGCNITSEKLEFLLTLNSDDFKAEVERIEKHFAFIGNTIPKALHNKLDELKKSYNL